MSDTATDTAAIITAAMDKIAQGGTAEYLRGVACDALVDLDVAKWGDSEREASRRHHAGRTVGLAVNELANRALFAEMEAQANALRKIAKAHFTAEDLSFLRSGG
jgi:hypothetical protein